MIGGQPTIGEVRSYWERNPLGTLESPFANGTREFFEWHNRIREAEEGAFTRHLYDFERHSGLRVLDVGCGNGWLVYNFAKNHAETYGVDLTETAIVLTRRRLDLEGLSAVLMTANAEALPFPDDAFDFVTSAGVLHHTPNTERAVHEAIRVLRSGGRGMISLYYQHPLMGRAVWPITRTLVRRMFAQVPGRRGFGCVDTVDDLVRRYDGDLNPIGTAYSRDAIRRLFSRCTVETMETHFFPTRFLLRGLISPYWLRKLFDRLLGLMIYVRFVK